MASSSSFTSILSSRAQKEITEAWSWYEERQQGLGDRFVKEVIARIHKIEQSPERYPTRYRYYKETPVPVFPFLLFTEQIRKRELIALFQYFILH